MVEKTVREKEFEAAMMAAYKRLLSNSEFSGFDRMIFLMSGMTFALQMREILFEEQKYEKGGSGNE